jgi:hypothetical protein
MGERLRPRPSYWPGTFLVHVGGTPHCVLFDHAVNDEAIAFAVRDEQRRFYRDEFEPRTE